MLSYQHIYHAGNRADIHKHALLAQALESLTRHARPSLYIETHAGRGLYDLRAPENEKTGEAANGWLKTMEDGTELLGLPASYLSAIRAVNGGALSPLYPGSPKIAAQILRKNDRLYLYDLHPAEFAALEISMKDDPRIRLEKRDGLEATLTGAKLHARAYGHALVFIDPSYEIKSEYETMPDFVGKLHAAMPKACILLWAPMLPALRHETTCGLMKSAHPDLQVSEKLWSDSNQGRGMFGSLVLGVNIPKNVLFT
ncbi:MAG: 23S rRNA (adenine(2030)-N(6))-methyltransferase RlmJ [Alphaproteobacteria bacterium]